MIKTLQKYYIRSIVAVKNFFREQEESKKLRTERKLYDHLCKTNELVISQRKNQKSIPVIIISYNQLFYLKQLIDFLLRRNFENIIILDNLSTYPPLLEYYGEIKEKVHVEFLGKNLGHKVFFENPELIEKFGKGYYFLTDPDIVPNENLPENFAQIMLEKLDQHFNKITKVGFALKIDDIPDSFKFKKEVLDWEAGSWKNEIEPDIFNNFVDTTFALYKPNYNLKFNTLSYYKGLRMGGNFTAKHGGWYIDHENLTEETAFYFKTTNRSSSWALDENGNVLAGYEVKQEKND